LEEARQRTKHWKRWGPYLSERAWGTVREDYSTYGSAWDYFPHDHARSRAYRWNEDGIAGISDRHQKKHGPVKDLAQAEAEYPGWLSRLLTHPVRG
jgi:hypothetical protein